MTDTNDSADYLAHLDLEKHSAILEEKMTYLTERIEAGTLSESDTALYHAIVSTNVMSAAVSASLREALKTVTLQQEALQALTESQMLMCEHLKRWHGIDLQQALMGLPKFTDPESDHG